MQIKSFISYLFAASILSVVALMLVSNFGTVDCYTADFVRSDIKGLAEALEEYRADNGHYPSLKSGLNELVVGRKKYLFKSPVDSWGNEYLYFITNSGKDQRVDIWSLGADGHIGGDGQNSDIKLSNL